MNSKVEKDVALASSIIKDYYGRFSVYGNVVKFQRPYLHSNESDYYKNFDFKNKSVLTVGSSCDQTFYSLLYGAKSVTLFDLNPFVKYVFDLKSSAIKTLSMWETRKLFPLKKEEAKLDFKEVVSRLGPNMSKESFEFWSQIGENFSHKEIIWGLFDRYGCIYPHFLQSQKEYNSLRNVLNSQPNVNFISSNLNNLSQSLSESIKFDFAFFSNVLDYYNPQQYKQDVKRVLPFMNKGALIQMNYTVNYPKMPNHQQNPNKLEKVEDLFGVEAINSTVYPHIRDFLPRPTSRFGSLLPAFVRERSIFVKADDLKNIFEEEDMNVIFEQGALNRYFANNPEGSVNLSQEEIEQMFAEADSHKETVASSNNYQHNSPEYVDGQGCVEVSSPELNGYEFPKISEYPAEDGQEL